MAEHEDGMYDFTKLDLSSFNLVHESESSTYRLYVKPLKNGFLAKCIKWVSCTSDLESRWDCPDCKCDSVFDATCYFDGIRHLEFKREYGDYAGYLYYPAFSELVKIMGIVEKMEREVKSKHD